MAHDASPPACAEREEERPERTEARASIVMRLLANDIDRWAEAGGRAHPDDMRREAARLRDLSSWHLDELTASRTESARLTARAEWAEQSAQTRARQIDELRADSSRLREAAKECADLLEAEVRARYGFPDVHPAMLSRYERDMDAVHAVYAALSPQPKEGA